jgi:hypothetical protein
MPLLILTGTGVRDTRERPPSVTEALQLLHLHMKLRRPADRVEDERGNPVSFFQLQEMAKLEVAKLSAPCR